MIRDILAGTKPLIFREEIYAMASVAGGLLYVGILFQTDVVLWAQIAAIISTVLIRIIAVRYKL